MTGLKKKLNSSPEKKKLLLENNHHKLTLSRQCELLGVSRSTFYYVPRIDPQNEELMRAIDEIYTSRPFYGSRRIHIALNRQGYAIGRRHVSSLMRRMGIQAIYPKPKTSIGNVEHEKYPYLLRDVTIGRPNHVWGTDITYIRMAQGFLYLVAFLDWFSRYVLSFQISNSLESEFCIEALERAFTLGIPEISNSDQGVQYTSKAYTSALKAKSIQISMDGRGRCHDNIFTERLWRSVKYEEVYLKDYRDPSQARQELIQYFHFYNYQRPHQSLGYKTPAEVYFQTVA